MHLSKTALAGTAALALTLSLGACSLSVNGSDSAGSSSPAASQAQKADAGSGGTAGSDSSTAKGSADAKGSDDKKDSDSDDAEKASVTDPAWKDIIDTGERKEVSGSYAVSDAGATLNLVGDLDTLTIQAASTKVAADSVGTLIVQGSDVVVYARDIDHVQIQGAGVTVHWLGDDPDIQDQGADNTTGKLTQ